MRYLKATFLTATVIALAACGGESVSSGESSNASPMNSLSFQDYSKNAYAIAHKTIIATRPKSTLSLVDFVNMELSNNNITTNTTASSVEDRVLHPLSDGFPKNTCPYLTKSTATNTASCRLLVKNALENALVNSATMIDEIEQDVVQNNQELTSSELTWIKGWAGQAVMSGIDIGATHTIDLLREQMACDQSPVVVESAFTLGETQGKALLEEKVDGVLQATPETQCNTDIIANAIYAEALAAMDSFIIGNTICADYEPGNLAEKVDLKQATEAQQEGLAEGLREAYEALRVRLVSTWVCIPPTPAPVPQPVPAIGDPLVVDLDGHGVTFTGRRAAFDLAATGETVQIPVLAAGNALLVMDLNHNGKVDSGAELLGNSSTCGARHCTDGIEALAAVDTNHDGTIDAHDVAFSSLRLWQDRNSDGQSSTDELRPLNVAKISAISLSARLDQAWTEQGSASHRSLTYKRSDGSTGTVYDVWYHITSNTQSKNPLAGGITSTLNQRR